jgi:hypothetical protein
MNNTEICHKFASGTQNASANNLILSNGVLYSFGYHYELAKFLDSNTVLINNKNGWGSYTGKHISLVTQSTRQFKQFFTLRCDYNLVLSQLQNLENKLMRANKPEIYFNQIQSLLASYSDYCKYLKKAVETEISYFGTLTIDLEKLRALKLRNEELRIKKETELIAKFANFETNYVKISYDVLRLENDKIRTSQNVILDLFPCKSLYNALKAGFDVVGSKIDVYTILENNKNTVKIGCHTFKKDYLLSFGANL